MHHLPTVWRNMPDYTPVFQAPRRRWFLVLQSPIIQCSSTCVRQTVGARWANSPDWLTCVQGILPFRQSSTLSCILLQGFLHHIQDDFLVLRVFFTCLGKAVHILLYHGFLR